MPIPRRIHRRVPNLVPIGPAVWQLPKTFECVTPLNPQVPPCVSRGKLLGGISIPRRICTCVPYLVPIGPAACKLPQTFEFVTPLNPRNAAWGIVGELYLAYVNSQTNPPTCTKFGANRCSHSQMNPQMWTNVCANRSSRLTASKDFWIVDPLKPPPPQVLPLCRSRGVICLAYTHSQTNLHMCAKFGGNRSSRLVVFPECVLRFSSALSRCARCLAQKKHAKKQHLYIENYNSGPNMTTSTSLTFVTAIFLALSGALADELMVMCRHVTTAL